MTIDKIHEIFDKKLVDGSIGKDEGLFLYNLARECRPNNGVIVEIGSANGLSTICLGLGSKDGHSVPVYSIDPHIPDMYTADSEWLETGDVTKSGIPDDKYYVGQGTGHLEYYDNIKKYGLEDIIVPIVNYSELAYKKGLKDEKGNSKEWDLDIQLLWIDGDHRYNYVYMDIELWTKHVVSCGKILLHDYPFPGVFRSINELIIGNPRYTNFRGVGVDPIVNVTVSEKLMIFGLNCE